MQLAITETDILSQLSGGDCKLLKISYGVKCIILFLFANICVIKCFNNKIKKTNNVKRDSQMK